jgi:hypothetical protein
MRAPSYRTFCSCDSRWVSLEYLSAGCRYTAWWRTSIAPAAHSPPARRPRIRTWDQQRWNTFRQRISPRRPHTSAARAWASQPLPVGWWALLFIEEMTARPPFLFPTAEWALCPGTFASIPRYSQTKRRSMTPAPSGVSRLCCTPSPAIRVGNAASQARSEDLPSRPSSGAGPEPKTHVGRGRRTL